MPSPAYAVVESFERTLADYAGAKHAVAVDSCTNALFLCCKYLNVDVVTLPARTYLSVPMAVIHAGGRVRFVDFKWQGVYPLDPYLIWDGSLRFRRGMYENGFQCISFSARKPIPIGKGGMIFTDDEKAAEWFRVARYEGRRPIPYSQDDIKELGWNMYMTPEQAARGLHLFQFKGDSDPDQVLQYPDLRELTVFRTHPAVVRDV